MNERLSSAPELLLTVEECARRLAIARSHLYLHIQAGTMPSIKIGRSRRIAVADLEAFVESRRTGVGLRNSLTTPLPVGRHVDGRMSTPSGSKPMENTSEAIGYGR